MSTSIDLPKSEIELDQEDLFARLSFAFPNVKVLLQRRGVTENDVQEAMGTFNAAGGKAGAVIIVLMPKLLPDMKDSAGPNYFARYGIQVLCWPQAALGAAGAGFTAEAIVETLMDLVHRLSFGRGGTLAWDGVEPVTVQPGKVSYVAYFRRLGFMAGIAKTATPQIAYETGESGLTITLTCITGGAQIWYSIDGTYPRPGATAAQYTAPFLISTPSIALTLRVAANADGQQPSNVAQMDIMPVVPAP